MPSSGSVEAVSLCQLAPPACRHIHPSCYHVPSVDKTAFGQSWACHHRRVEVQDNRRVFQLLPALSLPTMVCLCLEWSGRIALAAFKPFLETCDCVSGVQLCCRELTDCTASKRSGGGGLVFLCLNDQTGHNVFFTEAGSHEPLWGLATVHMCCGVQYNTLYEIFSIDFVGLEVNVPQKILSICQLLLENTASKKSWP